MIKLKVGEACPFSVKCPYIDTGDDICAGSKKDRETPFECYFVNKEGKFNYANSCIGIDDVEEFDVNDIVEDDDEEDNMALDPISLILSISFVYCLSLDVLSVFNKIINENYSDDFLMKWKELISNEFIENGIAESVIDDFIAASKKGICK